MMCLRPYGRPLGLLCAVTDVTHVNFKGFLLHFKASSPPCCCSAGWMGESAPYWSGKVCLSFCIQPPSSSSSSCPCSSAACTLTTPDFVLGERDHLKCPVQPTAAAPGPRHSLAQKRREGRGRCAPLCRAPPVVFLLFVPIDESVEVLAVAFVWVLFWWGCAVDGGAVQAHLAIWSGFKAHTLHAHRYRQVFYLSQAGLQFTLLSL